MEPQTVTTPAKEAPQSAVSSTLLGSIAVTLALLLALPLVLALSFFCFGVAGRAFWWMCQGF